MSENLINDGNFGAWLLKCNPEVWDIVGFMEDGEYWIHEWTVVDNYRSQMMTIGQPVVLWVSGPTGQTSIAPGIWGIGHVTGPVRPVLATESSDDDSDDPVDIEVETSSRDTGYWLDLKAAAKARYEVDVDIELLVDGIPREDLVGDVRFAGAEILSQPQMSNPSWLTDEQWAAVVDRIGEVVPEPFTAKEVADLELAATIQGPDPVTKIAIEQIAIAVVTEALTADGWTVTDNQALNLGWDLTAKRGRDERRIEVKGRGVKQARAVLTANEFHAASSTSGWELAVVTDALGTPRLGWYTAEEVVAAARAIAYTVAL